MKLDMANFTLAMTKPEIIANSVEIERKKFADYLAITPGKKFVSFFSCFININFILDGLEITRKWLLKHLDTSTTINSENYEAQIKNLVKTTFSRACIELLEWDPNTPFPEVSFHFFMMEICVNFFLRRLSC